MHAQAALLSCLPRQLLDASSMAMLKDDEQSHGPGARLLDVVQWAYCLCHAAVPLSQAARPHQVKLCRWLMQLLHNMGHDQATISSLVADY